MIDDTHDKARKDLEDTFVRLVHAELALDSPLRFQRAAKLCMKAHGVLQIYSTRVADVAEGDDEIQLGGNYVGHQMGAVRIRGQAQMPAEDIFREVVAMAEPLFRAQAEEARERRLSRLIGARANLITMERHDDVPAIDSRIQEILNDLSQEQRHESDVDGPKLLRRYSLGDGNQQADADDRGQGDGEGTNGIRAAANHGT